MSKSVLVLFANGAEEIETVSIVNVLRRAEVKVVLASIQTSPDDNKTFVICSRGVNIVPDCDAASANDCFDAVVLPGGMPNAQTLAKSEVVQKILKKHDDSGKLVAAICAAPIVLKAHGIKAGSRSTCYPALKSSIEDHFTFVDEKVVQDDNLITSQGPATAMEFALKLIEFLMGEEKRSAIAKDLLFN